MSFPLVSWLPILVAGAVIFFLGGLWYSPVLFAKRWMALIGKTEAEMKAASGSLGLLYAGAVVSSFVIAFTLAVTINHFANMSAMKGALVGGFCWFGFAAATSFPTASFSGTPKALWAINSGYNLVSFVVAGTILGGWR